MEKFYKWVSLSETLKKVKLEEMKLRKELAIEVLRGMGLPAKKVLMIDENRVEFEQGVNYKLDELVINSMFRDLSDIEKNALKYSPKLKLREYKIITDTTALIHEAVTTKPTAPTIKIK